MARHRTLVTYLAAYFFAIGTAFRYLSLGRYEPERWTATVEWAIAGLFLAFFLLSALEPWLSRRSHRNTHVYLAVQTVIISVLSLITPAVDYFSALFMSLILQAMYVFPLRIGLRWTVFFTVIMATLMLYGHPLNKGLPLVVIMSMAYLFFGSYAAVTREAETAREEAETARKESQRLLGALQDAHQQLQVYTTQAEELAVAAERSRLARELHDSVTQSLYSLTLFTQAARELAEAGSLEQVKRNLARIADTAGQGLKEMRLLVYELRPLALEDTGLVGALQQRLDMVERRSGVQTRLLVEPNGDVELPAPYEEALYRIAEEALNNALKHAHTTSVTVRMAVTPSTGSPVPAAQVQAGQAPSASRRGEPVEPSGQAADGKRLEFEVSDDGCGFDLDVVKDKGGLGLTSIRERVAGLGGELSVHSAPGQGTRLRVEMEMKP